MSASSTIAVALTCFLEWSINRRVALVDRLPHGLDALGGEVTFLLQLLHDALALLLAWNPSNDVCGLRYALGGVIHAQ